MTADSVLHLTLEELRHSGANRFDPVRFRYLEACEQRLRGKDLQNGPHWQKLEQAVSEYQARLKTSEQPEPASAPPEPSPLSTLLNALNQPAEAPATTPRSALEQRIFGATEEPSSASGTGTPQPLKAMARAKADQSTHALHDRIQQAIESTPKDAGPMNAHRLVSRAIAEMQKLSPEYLNRLVNYTDTLMVLEKLGRKGG
ncbi:DUF2894 domain-containing protein [Marinobacter sp. ANT_B65]|uniref:DUF2894 domain-containing protein n=1 Tax=Marinobacter sp. ANT_B65 TaxID=2039467 RepID=UPI000BBE2EAD|nr:DUF2894 domain-containing protein [Marinobacter sp. ANT_B65]PCM44835.1 hypothetical protein CPA50_02015 [Marinobacter sp. ANT_B65]